MRSTYRRTNVYHSVLAAYEQQYIKQKADKRLLWIPQIGKVSLHIELADRSLDVEVGVVEAAIIELFGEKGEDSFEKHCIFLLTLPITDVWTLNELAEALGTDVNVARKAAAQWIELRVVNEDTPHTYRLLEKQEAETTSVANRGDEVDAPSAAPARQQQAEQVRVFWRVSQFAGSTPANPNTDFCAFSSSKACSRTWAQCQRTAFNPCSSLPLVMIGQSTSCSYSSTLRVERDLWMSKTEFGRLLNSISGVHCCLGFINVGCANA